MDTPVIDRAAWRRLGWLGIASLCVLCLLPPPQLMESGIPHADKFFHGAAYGLLMWWNSVANERHYRWRWALGLLLLGITLEGLQGLTPERSMSAWDVLANSVGIVIGFYALRATPSRFPFFDRAKTEMPADS